MPRATCLSPSTFLPVTPPLLYTIHPSLIVVVHREHRFIRTFFPDGRPPVISYSLSSAATLDGDITDDQNVAGYPSDWPVVQSTTILVGPRIRESLASDYDMEQEATDLVFPGDAEAAVFSKKLATRVLAMKEIHMGPLIIERPMPLWAVASANREITAASREPPRLLSFAAGYNGFLELMVSLWANLLMLTADPILVPHHLVELTPEDLVNKVKWERFPQL